MIPLEAGNRIILKRPRLTAQDLKTPFQVANMLARFLLVLLEGVSGLGVETLLG